MSTRIVLLATSSVSAGIGAFLGINYETWKNKQSKLNQETGHTPAFLSRLALPIVSAATTALPPSSNLPAEYGVPVSPSRSSEIMKHGFPGFDNLRSYGDFVLSYDQRNRTAHWVFEHLTREKVKRVEGISREESQFKEDTTIHPYFRATNEDYHRSGYDRGHLAAAGNHRFSQKAMDETFYLSNISPQVGKGFNRDAWNLLEKFVRHLTKKYSNVYVCTGPLYLPSQESNGKLYVKYEVIGKNHVAVPTHFFKVVVMEQPVGQYELMSFVMPNQAIGENIDLKKYLVPLESIERAAGLLFFQKIPRNSFKKINGR